MKNEKQMIEKCRVCAATTGIVYLCDTYNEHSKTTSISHYRCTTCGSVFVGNSVDGEELGVAYSTLDSKKYYEEIVSENIKKMNTSSGYLKSVVHHDASIIDVGTGDGLFVEVLRKAGFSDVSAHEIEGTDLTKINNIASYIYQDFDYKTIPSDKFDAITLLDVVEHVIEPQYLIETCARILKDGGLIYFHTPVVTKTDRFMHFLLRLPILKKAGAIWQRGRTSIFHLANYTPESLTLILEDAGFSEIDIKVKNELSWPVTKYVRTYLLEKQGLPGFIAPLLSPFFYPLLATDTFNANKSIVSARKVAKIA
jgi:2-polyprenyl-3-methyl-5-hydroxy-6-metoxy-1,4-benzoquinol methylase